ncbi:MAG: AmmeMemoRadiSam system radical SAM enzyme [Trueperella sp.]|nr:AmmeMemoRadiSam system radical SAM enzyme [Trueperella sp.]
MSVHPRERVAGGGAVGQWWQEIDDGRIQCDLCPRFCRLREGQRGFCFVRLREDDQIILDTYGRTSGLAIDPIEKKPLYHVRPGTTVLSFGTAGCNLACKFCQNWSISKSREIDSLHVKAEPTQIAEIAQRHGCDSVAFTYNDPTIFAEYAIDTAIACHEAGIRTVAVSAGYISPEPRADMYRHMDAANIDLKAFSEDFYWKLTGAHLQPVLDTISYVANETDCFLELTTLVIPDHNDTPGEIGSLAHWVLSECGPDTPLHFSAFHPDWKMRDVPRTPLATLRMAREIALEVGLNHVYLGNVRDPGSASTHCPTCSVVVVERDTYRTPQIHPRDGACHECGTSIAGMW